MMFKEKYYYALCKERYAQFGFVRIGKTHARIINDVFQTFTLKCMSPGNVYTVEFGIFPLCMVIPDCEIGTYRLEAFVLNERPFIAEWVCSGNTKEAVQMFWKDFFDVLDDNLIPVFQKAESCSTALVELCKLDAMLDEKRKDALLRSGEIDRAVPWQERSLCAPEKYYMALKNRDWEYAQRYLQNQIRLCTECIEGERSKYQPAFVKERYMLKKEELLMHLVMLQQKDIGFFDNLLDQNEVISRTNLQRVSKELL